MKSILEHIRRTSSVFILLSAVFLTGCATPLDRAVAGPRLAQKLGRDASKVRFVGNCNFAAVDKSERNSTVYSTLGLVGLIGDDLILARGSLDKPAPLKSSCIPISSMGGVDLRKFGMARQIQIPLGNRLLLLNVMVDSFVMDGKGTEELYELLLKLGVSRWQGAKFYTLAILPDQVDPFAASSAQVQGTGPYLQALDIAWKVKERDALSGAIPGY
jgi:hypothetical protein